MEYNLFKEKERKNELKYKIPREIEDMPIMMIFIEIMFDCKIK